MLDARWFSAAATRGRRARSSLDNFPGWNLERLPSQTTAGADPAAEGGERPAGLARQSPSVRWLLPLLDVEVTDMWVRTLCTRNQMPNETSARSRKMTMTMMAMVSFFFTMVAVGRRFRLWRLGWVGACR